MSKFAKRIQKYIIDDKSALVIGNAFGHLDDLSGIFKTIFVVSETEKKIRYRNVVYRESFDKINDIGEVSVILVDLDKVSWLEQMPTYWTRFSPIILIEGNELIDRTKSAYLYKYGYRCIDKLGFSHAWKKI